MYFNKKRHLFFLASENVRDSLKIGRINYKSEMAFIVHKVDICY